MGDRIYRDGLGYEYRVPPDQQEEFERRRGVLLRIAILGQLLILGGMMYFLGVDLRTLVLLAILAFILQRILRGR